MKSLILTGYGINMNVDGGKLHIRDGVDKGRKNPQEYTFMAKHMDYDNIVVYGHSGNISLDAFKWLTKMNIPLTLLNWDGKLLTSVIAPRSKQSLTRLAQYDAYQNGKRLGLAKCFIDAKIQNSKCVLEWLGKSNPTVRKLNENNVPFLEENRSLLESAKNIGTIMGIEGKVGGVYWIALTKTFDKKFDFGGRLYGKTPRPAGAVDPINALFNYGYAILESHCWRAVHTNGLDPYIGFLHSVARSKAPLIYDLQEPYRWLVDVAILKALDDDVFSSKDFIRTENYNVRVRPEGATKLIEEINRQLTKTAKHGKYNHEWGHLITIKTRELAKYIKGERRSMDFGSPMANV